MEFSTPLTDLSLAHLLNQLPLENPLPERLRYGFSVGLLNFVYDTAIACELVKAVPIYPIPNTPAWLLGVINLRGGLVPAFNLARYFDFQPPIDSPKLLLVLGKDEKAVAFQLNRYPELLNNLTKLPSLPPFIPQLNGFILNAYRSPNKQLWLELDKEAFFTALGEKVSA